MTQQEFANNAEDDLREISDKDEYSAARARIIAQARSLFDGDIQEIEDALSERPFSICKTPPSPLTGRTSGLIEITQQLGLSR
jgi:hypothetical protein